MIDVYSLSKRFPPPQQSRRRVQSKLFSGELKSPTENKCASRTLATLNDGASPLFN